MVTLKGACPPWSEANLEVLWLHPVRATTTVFTSHHFVTSTSDQETSNRKGATLQNFAPPPTQLPLLRRREATWLTTRWTTLRGTRSLRAMTRSLESPWRSWEILWSWGALRLSIRSRTRTATCRGSAAAWKPHLSKVGWCPTLQTLTHRDFQRPCGLVSLCFYQNPYNSSSRTWCWRIGVKFGPRSKYLCPRLTVQIQQIPACAASMLADYLLQKTKINFLHALFLTSLSLSLNGLTFNKELLLSIGFIVGI